MTTNETVYSDVLCSPQREVGYHAGVRLLHWLSAAVIIAAWGLGVGLEAFPRGAARGAAIDVHSTLGIAVFSLTVLRILWRGATGAPPLEGPEWMVRLAQAGHAALYGFALAVPFSGLLARWAYSGSATLIGGLVIPAPLPLPPSELWGDAHAALATAFSVLVAGHIAAALYHHVVLKDSTLRRMLPQR
jgi:cytochrome b561